MPRSKKCTLQSISNILINFFNYLITGISLTVIAISIFLLISDWSTINKGFFLGWCITVILFSVLVSLIIYTGNLGITYQQLKTGYWTGNRLLLIYQVGILCTFIAILYLSTVVMKMNKSFRDTRDQIHSTDDFVPYDSFEERLSDRFNDFFFATSTSCGTSSSTFFWGFIDDHCPESISSTNCEACYDYSITLCPADESTCNDPNNPYQSMACPYEICRVPVLDYLISYLKPTGDVLLLFAIVEIVLMFITCLSICSTKSIPSSVNSSNQQSAIHSESDPFQQHQNNEHVGLEMSEGTLITQHVGF